MCCSVFPPIISTDVWWTQGSQRTNSANLGNRVFFSTSSSGRPKFTLFLKYAWIWISTKFPQFHNSLRLLVLVKTFPGPQCFCTRPGSSESKSNFMMCVFNLISTVLGTDSQGSLMGLPGFYGAEFMRMCQWNDTFGWSSGQNTSASARGSQRLLFYDHIHFSQLWHHCYADNMLNAFILKCQHLQWLFSIIYNK